MLKVSPTGSRPGTVFTLPQVSVAGGPTFVFLNGQLLAAVAASPSATQYILSSTALTMGMTIEAADDLFVFIQTVLAYGLVRVSIAGTKNSSNLTYVLGTAPPSGSSVLFTLNGGTLNQVSATPTPQQCVVSGTSVTLGVAPAPAEDLDAWIEDQSALTFFHEVTMQGSGTRWAGMVGMPTTYTPAVLVYLNGQLQTEVTTFPTTTQYQFIGERRTLTLRFGISITSSDILQVFLVGLRAGPALSASLPTYLDMQNELLVLMNERIDVEEAKMCLNRRWQKILQAWTWSFNKPDGVLTTRAPKTGGTVAVTQDSTLVVGINTAFAATDSGAYLVLGQQPYLVIDVQVMSATQQMVLLSSSYTGATVSASTYQLVYKDYALDPDVIDILSLAGPNWSLNEITQVALDVVDTRRAFIGQPSSFARRGMVNGAYGVEIWPVPDARYTLRYIAITRSLLTNQGQMIPDMAECLLMAAQEMACGIVASKEAADKNYEGAGFWTQKGQVSLANYTNSLEECKGKDRRRFGRNDGNRGRSLAGFRDTPGYDVGW